MAARGKNSRRVAIFIFFIIFSLEISLSGQEPKKIDKYFKMSLQELLDEEIRFPNFTLSSWATRGTLGHGRRFLVSIGWKF